MNMDIKANKMKKKNVSKTNPVVLLKHDHVCDTGLQFWYCLPPVKCQTPQI